MKIWILKGLLVFGDEDDVPPQQDKQTVPKPPTYEESLDVLPYEPPPPPQNMSTLKMMMKILTMLWIKKTRIMRYWMTWM